MNRKFTKEQELQICKEYFSKEKLGIVVLAKKWNCSTTAISNAIEKNGHDLRTISEANKGHKAWNKLFSKEEEEQICDEYFSKEKLGITFLGEKWNCSNNVISNIIKRNGYDLRPYSEANSTPEAIQRSLKNSFGVKCYYNNEYFPSLGERDCYIYIIKLGYLVIHNWLGRFDFLVILPNNRKVVVEYHPYDRNGLTNKQYYMKRRKLLNKYGYKDLKLVVIKDLKEIESKLGNKI